MLRLPICGPPAVPERCSRQTTSSARRGPFCAAAPITARREHSPTPARTSPSLAIEHVVSAVEDEAWSWLARHDERSYSFVDATSFAVMRRQHMTEAFAFDGDFSAAGVVEFRPD